MYILTPVLSSSFTSIQEGKAFLSLLWGTNCVGKYHLTFSASLLTRVSQPLVMLKCCQRWAVSRVVLPKALIPFPADLWSTEDSEAAADVNLPPCSVCWFSECSHATFNWSVLSISALLRNNSPNFKRLALGLERRVVYHNNYGHFFQEGWFVCVFSCFGVEGQCDKQDFLFQSKMATP